MKTKGKTKEMGKILHRSVLLNEVIEGLDLGGSSSKTKKVIVDGTFGGGGHAKEICKLAPKSKIIALDQDQSALTRGKVQFKKLKCDITFVNANFRDLGAVLKKEKVAEIDALLLDLGLSSDQLESSGRGFSFLKNEPLLMTMKENPNPTDLTAKEIVNNWSEKSLADIIYGYGEERFSRKIAASIVRARGLKNIETTTELVDVIAQGVPGSYKRGRLHFATRTFQALRIAVNDELQTLEKGLAAGFSALKGGGRLAVISFHSLEDRIVKRFYKNKEKEGEAQLLSKKPIIASDPELLSNPRARSAKLRILKKL